MSVDIRVPTLGESVTEATVGQWFKKVGDAIAADEPLVELETDKVTIEVPAPSAGVLEAIVVEAGQTVNVGALIGAIASAGAAASPKPVEAPAAVSNGAATPAANGNGAIPPAPSAAKLMAENGIANGDVEGSGKHGQVLKEDVLAAITRPVTVATPTPLAPMSAASLTSSAAPVAVSQNKAAEPLASPVTPPPPAAAPQPVAAAQRRLPRVPRVVRFLPKMGRAKSGCG
jgi:2-oxoglutarate dehydrogenase E2 component (dihydrolipoamide succinyltransferase)